MKTMKNLMIAVALFMGATTFTNAQSKTAHVDTQALVESMPEMKAAQSQLENTYISPRKIIESNLEKKHCLNTPNCHIKTLLNNQYPLTILKLF